MEQLCSSQPPIICCSCDKNLSPCDVGGDDNKLKTITRYKCPGCGRFYCSASCCSSHKDKFDCLGIRDQTPYVPLDKFDQKQFLDDFFFLEKINGQIERAQRILPRLKVRQNPNPLNTKSKRSNRNNRRKKFKVNREAPSSGGVPACANNSSQQQE